jgi:hypothetical protein
MSYEVTGPFAGAEAIAQTATTEPPAESTDDAAASDDDGGGSDLALPLVGGAMVLGLAATGAAVWRVRTRGADAGGGDAADSDGADESNR